MESYVDSSKIVEVRDEEKEAQIESENGQEQSSNGITTEFVDDSIEPPASDIYASSNIGQSGSSEELLKPTFVKSSLLHIVRPKGNSRVNLAKGKRPRMRTDLVEIDGDLLVDLDSSKLTFEKQMFELSQTSQMVEKRNRTKNTLILRIEEMHQKKLFTLSDCINLFMSETIPISMYLPISLSVEGLSNILKVDPCSSIMQTLHGSRVMQDVVRKTMLETKMLPVCSCGYIYVEPGLCFARHPTDPAFVVGKISPSGKVSTMRHADVIMKLNAIRFFLEILYEYHNNK
jgi:hypothetical protein